MTYCQNQVRHAIEQYLDMLIDALQSEYPPCHWQTQLECGISIRFYPAHASRTSKFKLEQVDASTALGGGLVVSDSINSINRCIVEKTEKTKDKTHLYAEWWLVLVDHNVYTPGNWETDEWNTIRKGLVDTSPWSRIVVISWMDGLMHTDLIQND